MIHSSRTVAGSSVFSRYPEPARGPDGLGLLIALVLSIPLWGAVTCGLIWWLT